MNTASPESVGTIILEAVRMGRELKPTDLQICDVDGDPKKDYTLKFKAQNGEVTLKLNQAAALDLLTKLTLHK